MFIDMHMHEMRYSKDSFLMLEEIVEIARKRGLDAICITDHDDMGLKEFAKEYSEKTGFLIFVGIEFFSLQGDIVALGIEEYPPERVSAQEFIDCVKRDQTYTLKAKPKEKKIEISRRWAELVIQHKYTSESVAWEVVLKVLIWIADEHAPIITNDEIADELHISVSTIVSAKNVLERDIGAIIKEIDKITLVDGSKRNKGQWLATVADWSE